MPLKLPGSGAVVFFGSYNNTYDLKTYASTYTNFTLESGASIAPSVAGATGVNLDVAADTLVLSPAYLGPLGNKAASSVTGGAGSTSGTAGGTGIDVTAGTLINFGAISGGAGSLSSTVSEGGAGVILNGGTASDESGGTITGGNGATSQALSNLTVKYVGAIASGVGVLLDAGTFTTNGAISGGTLTDGTHQYPLDSVLFGPTGTSTLVVESGAAFAGDIGGFNTHDTIDITNAVLTVSSVTANANGTDTLTTPEGGLVLVGVSSGATFTFKSDGHGGTDVSLACYRRGTRILTDQGERSIESLAIGDRVVTLSGDLRAIRWLGHRGIECARQVKPSALWPIRIRAHAIAEARPVRDLWVSPGHCVYVDGVLIQAEKLVNGVTIERVPLPAIEYWHLELDGHDVIFAEGLESETYLDTGNRTAFANGGEFVEQFPDFRPRHWADTCMPLVLEGPVLRHVRGDLMARARALGHAITEDSDAHLMADGARIDPVWLDGRRMAFLIPAQCDSVELACRTFVPAQVTIESADDRHLGLCVGRLQVDGDDVDLHEAACFVDGWYGVEAHADGWRRWSQGRAMLPAGARLVVVELASRSYCWVPADVGIGADAASASTFVSNASAMRMLA